MTTSPHTKPSRTALTSGLVGALPLLALVCQTATAHAATAPAGQKTLSLRADAYHDRQFFDAVGPDDLASSVSALDVTGDGSGTGLYGSVQQAWAAGRVTATSIGVYSRSYAYAQSALYPYYSASAAATAQASVTTPFLLQGGGTTGTRGTLVATLLVSGGVDVGPGLYDQTTHAEASGRGYMYFWATGLNASGCGYYSDAGCLSITRIPQFHPGSGITIDTLVESNDPIRAWTLHIPFHFGSWSTFRLDLWSGAQSFVAADGSGGFVQHHAESDFLHTLRWGGVSAVLDANGQQVSGWSIESLPGVDLRVAAVPEPQTWAMLLAGLGLLGWMARCRR